MTMNMGIRKNTGVTVLCLRGKKGDYRNCVVCWEIDDHIQPRVQQVGKKKKKPSCCNKTALWLRIDYCGMYGIIPWHHYNG